MVTAMEVDQIVKTYESDLTLCSLGITTRDAAREKALLALGYTEDEIKSVLRRA